MNQGCPLRTLLLLQPSQKWLFIPTSLNLESGNMQAPLLLTITSRPFYLFPQNSSFELHAARLFSLKSSTIHQLTGSLETLTLWLLAVLLLYAFCQYSSSEGSVLVISSFSPPFCLEPMPPGPSHSMESVSEKATLPKGQS